MNISFSESDLQSLPQPLKDALLIEFRRRLQGDTALEPSIVSPAPAPIGAVNEEEDQPADLSIAQAKRHLEGCSEKTKKAIRFIVGGNSREFQISALAKALGMKTNEMGGLWSGLTKRTRTVLGDKKARLFAWPKNQYDVKENWIDATGTVSEMTYTSFRTALGM
jgi:hypothetical protein